MTKDMTRGDKYSGRLSVGQRVHSMLYGGRDGIITSIKGEQRPETVRAFGGGAVVMGGSAYVTVAFQDGTISHGIPESIIRGVQWYISGEIASLDEISGALTYAEATKIAQDRERELIKAEREKQRSELPGRYPHLKPKDNKTSSHALGAANIRRELKRAFPGVRFSVRSKSFSGGDSIDVYWTDGPLSSEVDEIARKYQEGSFDGMTDSYNYNRDNVFPDIFGGAKYVFCNRRESPALVVKAAASMGITLTLDQVDRSGQIEGLDWNTSQQVYYVARETRGKK